MSEDQIIAELLVSESATVSRIVRRGVEILAERTNGHVKPDEPDELLTIHQVAGRLHQNRSTIYEKCRDGSLECVRDGKLVFVKRSALETYIAEREVRGPLRLKVSNMLYLCSDRQNHAAEAQTVGTHAKGARGQNRRAPRDASEVGERHGGDT
jgi:excisionase family DNA binding protein